MANYKELHEKYKDMSPFINPGVCDVPECGEKALTQGRCYDHCVTCPKCGIHPCNGDGDDPYCDECIQKEYHEAMMNEIQEGRDPRETDCRHDH